MLRRDELEGKTGQRKIKWTPFSKQFLGAINIRHQAILEPHKALEICLEPIL